MAKGHLLADLSGEMSDAVEAASQWVVGVDARRRLPATGIIWANGVVVTADHVLERDEDIGVILADGQRVEATVAGRDPGSDVAALRITGPTPATAPHAPAGSTRVGEIVLALGRIAGGPMASLGIVSALVGRWRTPGGAILTSAIQADLVLYPGFSGGPLLDAQGRLIGLNSSYLARGLAVAVPVDAVATSVETLLKEGRIRRAYLGITSQVARLSADSQQRLSLQQETGLLVVGVEPGSAAEQGGLLLGDVLIHLGDQTITRTGDLQAALASVGAGKAAAMTVIRGGESKALNVTLGERN